MPSGSSDPLPLVRAVQRELRTHQLGRPMEGHAVLRSTNERALTWAQTDAPEGSTVVTDHQTAGRGRHGRCWESEAGQNLTFSVVLRPSASEGSTRLPLRPHRLGLLALASGLAVCETVAEVIPAGTPRLKWPNDVLLDNSKCCGILIESAASATTLGPVVVGIGLNVNQRAFPKVATKKTPPTSLALAAGRPVARAPLLAQLLQRLEVRYQSLFEDGGQAVRQACEERLAALDQSVTVRCAPSGAPIEGTFIGLAPDGAMRLRLPEGERILHAGDVTIDQ